MPEPQRDREQLASLLRPAERSGECFVNPVPTEVGDWRLAVRVLPLYFSNLEQRAPSEKYGFKTDTSRFGAEPASGLRVTWFGHSGALIEMDGLRVLLDPVWDRRASPFAWVGPKRFFPPTLALSEMPGLDAIVVSHDHYDHLGAATTRDLCGVACARDVKWITSLGVGSVLARYGVAREKIVELDWTESTDLQSARTGASAVLTAYPARHFSGRSLQSRFRTLWSSFVLTGTRHTIYLGADSGWWPGFSEIAARHAPFDLTMLEIGAFNELWSDIHLGPDGAARAFQDMGAHGLLMPIHWGLFDLALHPWRQPIERLTELAAGKGLKIWSPTPGEPTDVYRNTELRSDWWRPADSGV